MRRALIVVAAGLSLAACATPTVYAPSTGARTSVGFSDYRIETGRYRVTYTGGGGAPMTQVADYALLRAAARGRRRRRRLRRLAHQRRPRRRRRRDQL